MRHALPSLLLFLALFCLSCKTRDAVTRGEENGGTASKKTSVYTFERVIDFGFFAEAHDILETKNGYIVVGAMKDAYAAVTDAFFLMLDSQGAEIALRRYQSKSEDKAYAVAMRPKGGYVIVGSAKAVTPHAVENVLFMAVDENGNEQERIVFPSPVQSAAYAVTGTGGDSYILVGDTIRPNRSDADMLFMHIDAKGGVLLTTNYGGANEDRARGIVKTDDGMFAVVGHTRSFGKGNSSMHFFLVNSEGALKERRTFGGTSKDEGAAIAKLPNGGFALVGFTSSFDSKLRDRYLVILNGETAIERYSGGENHDYLFAVDALKNGGSIAAGQTYSSDGSGDAELTLFNETGDIIFEKRFSAKGKEAANAVRATKDGGFIFAGYSAYSGGRSSVYIVKTDSAGTVTQEPHRTEQSFLQ